MSSRPGELYEFGAAYQPDERPLPLTVADLFALDAALVEAGDVPRQIRFDRFAVEASLRAEPGPSTKGRRPAGLSLR
jgi:hypothetical protein